MAGWHCFYVFANFFVLLNSWCQVTSAAVAAAKSLQSCLTLCDPRDGSPLGSPVPGILQARTLEWVASSFSSAWKWKVKVKSLSCVRLLVTPWTVAHQAPPSMGFSRQEYWSGVPFPSPLLSRRQVKYSEGGSCGRSPLPADKRVIGKGVWCLEEMWLLWLLFYPFLLQPIWWS